MRIPTRGRRLTLLLGVVLGVANPVAPGQREPAPKRRPKPGLPRPQLLGKGLELRRDAATGELRPRPASPAGGTAGEIAPPRAIRARISLVEVSCQVLAADGTALRGLDRDAFRLFEDGTEQTIAHFDVGTTPASIALVLDASPSVFRELGEMKSAERALAATLSPHDEVAVVTFSSNARLLLPFSRDRALLEQALASPELAQVEDSSQSNIYQAIYLTAHKLFGDRVGRKAIVVLTDGQDSGLGLSWDPLSAEPQPGEKINRLTFEDVARELAVAGVQVYAISTQTRPLAMTHAWLEGHRSQKLITAAAREQGMTHYTLYLAELVRRAGGQLFFLRELGALGDAYRRIAEDVGAEYTLGYYPADGLARPGWHALRVELTSRGGPAGTRINHRVAYYVSAEP